MLPGPAGKHYGAVRAERHGLAVHLQCRAEAFLRGLAGIASLMLSVYLSEALVSWLQTYVMAKASQQAVNDIRADLHDADTVYVALDNHKYGDFAPYLVKSTDRGRSWTSITGNLPDRHLVWRMVQDHVQPDLLFAGTELGVAAKKIMDEGGLVSDDIIIGLVIGLVGGLIFKKAQPDY